jgi:predicted dehydrogenase
MKNLLGELVEYEAHFDRYRIYVKPDSYKEADQPGSGILYDLGTHLLDQALLLFGKPNSICADIRRQRKVTKVDDYFDINLEYGKLKVILKAGMIVREKGPHFILHGQNGSFAKYGMDPQEEALFNGYSPPGNRWGVEPELQWGTLNTDIDGLHYRGKIETLPGNYGMFYSKFYDAVVKGDPVPVDPVDARNVIRLIEMAEESNRKKKSIMLTENDLI